MVSVPVCVPELVGAEATLIAQLAPTAKEPPQLLVSTNCPETVTLLKVTLAVPVLRTVTVCEPLVCPTLTLPKLRLVGRSEEHTSELQSRENLVCRLLL